jgi:hypothetical protein
MGAPAAAAAGGAGAQTAGGAAAGGAATGGSTVGTSVAALGIDSGMSLLSNLIGLGAAKRSQRRSFKFSERMSSTAYQRATKDMLEAGLNPVLMYGSGSASSTPGAPAPVSNVHDMGNKAQLAHQIYNLKKLQKSQRESLAEDVKTKQTTQNVNNAVTLRELSQRDINLEEKKRKAHEVITEQEKARMYSASAAAARATEANNKIQALLRSLEKPRAAAHSKVYKSWVGKNILPWLKELFGEKPAEGIKNIPLPPINIYK